jgi:hypothetical protein
VDVEDGKREENGENYVSEEFYNLFSAPDIEMIQSRAGRENLRDLNISKT